MKHARSTIITDNLQEVLDAESTAEHALLGGQQQYLTPAWFVDQCAARLPNKTPETVLDPQCGEGALVNLGRWSTSKFGFDIDNRVKLPGVKLIIGNCVEVAEVSDDVAHDLHWECINCNPPFGKKWKLGEGEVDSTERTWKSATSRGNYGFFIANNSTLVKQGIDKHPWVYHYETIPGLKLWKGMRETLVIGVAFWKRPEPKRATNEWEISASLDKVERIVTEEALTRPAFNIYLDRAGVGQEKEPLIGRSFHANETGRNQRRRHLELGYTRRG